MTGNTSKFRAVILAALMVFSVFAGTVAFAGSASAGDISGTAPTYQGNAVHYDNGSNPIIEVPFSENINLSTVDNESMTLLDDGDEATQYVDHFENKSGTVIVVLDEVVPSNDLELELSSDIKDNDDKSITNPGTKTVVFAGKRLSFSNTGGSTADAPGNATVYQGTTVAVEETTAEDVSVVVEGTDNSYYREGSTGVNSSVYTLNTDNRDLGEYKIYLSGSDSDQNRTYITVRDLGLSVSVDDTSVTTEDSIEGTISAVAGGRDVTVDLLDSNGDSINDTTVTLNGQGEADFNFDAGSADEGDALSSGNYSIEVTDQSSGVSAESSSVTVSEAADDDASFAMNTMTDQRGDVFEFTVEMDSTDTATVVFGSSGDGVIANATLIDDDGDGQVTAYLNTTDLVNANSQNAYSLDSDSDDEIDSQTVHEDVSDLIDAGEYDFDVRPGSDATADSTGVATVVLEERSTSGIKTWTLPNSVSVSDLEDINEAAADGELTQSSDIANGDKVVHEIEASGLEGFLDAQHNEGITNRFLDKRGTVYNFTVEQADAGANQQAWNLSLTSNNVSVVADGDNDTYYVVVNTRKVNQYGTSNGIPDDEDLTANFTVFGDDASSYGDLLSDEYDDDENEETLQDYTVVEPTISVDEPYNVSQASGQTVSGTTSLAPGTELSLRVRSQSGTSPSFLKTASPVVQSDGTWSTTFDFSGQNVGDEYEIVVDDGSNGADEVTEDGTVVEQMMTDTATPEPDTATPEPDTATPEPDTATPEPDTATPEPDTDTPTSTPTSTPGFGVVVALTALVAAALLAIRRD